MIRMKMEDIEKQFEFTGLMSRDEFKGKWVDDYLDLYRVAGFLNDENWIAEIKEKLKNVDQSANEDYEVYFNTFLKTEYEKVTEEVALFKNKFKENPHLKNDQEFCARFQEVVKKKNAIMFGLQRSILKDKPVIIMSFF